MSPDDHFSFAFSPPYRRAARLFGVAPENCEAVITDTELRVRFGRWRLRTPVANVADVSVTGPYRFIKTAGPARLAVTDRGLTFATNGDRGVLLSFHARVPGIEPTGLLRHPELTLTVADIEGFCAAMNARRAQASAA